VIYQVVPTVNGCAGLMIYDTIIVKPLPVVTAPIAQSICSNTSSAAVNLQSTIAGTTYAWNTPGNSQITGATWPASGSTSTIPSYTLTNTSATTQSLTFTITPSYNGCAGSPVSFTISVSATPGISFSPVSQTICSGTASAVVNLSSPTPNTTLTWTLTSNPGNVSGVSSSGGSTIPVQTLNNPSTSPQTVTYTASSSTSGGGGGCGGVQSSCTIIVNPIPVAVATPSTSSLCSGVTSNIALSSTTTGTTFSWTVNAPAGISGALNGSGSVIAQSLSNSTSGTLAVTYTVTPSYTNGGKTCTGTPITAVVNVYPSPIVSFSLPNQTICSGATSTAIALSSTTAGTTFTWTGVGASGLLGVTASSNGNSNTIGAQPLTNNGTTPLTSCTITATQGRTTE
jgi:hypothetical protein